VLATLLISAPSAHTDEKTKLTGEQHANGIQGYEVLAGDSKDPGFDFNFMVVAYQYGTRELYWSDGIKCMN
jgi:hypothetical protein